MQDKNNNKNEIKPLNIEEGAEENAISEHVSASNELGDEQRVKVLSPGMLVVRRFLRNRLAIIGFAVILFMFAFSFLGGLFSPYDESQVFKYVGEMSKEYASVTENNDFRFTVKEDVVYNAAAHAKFILAKNSGKSTFVAGDFEYFIFEEGEDFYRIMMTNPIAKMTNFRGVVAITPLEGETISDELKAATQLAITNKETQFQVEGSIFSIQQKGREFVLRKTENAAIESKYIVDPANPDTEIGYDFEFAVEKAIRTEGTTSFTVGEEEFEIQADENSAIILKKTSTGSEEYAMISKLAIQPISSDVFLTLEFRKELEKAISAKETAFTFKDESGADVEYLVNRTNNVYTIKKDTKTDLISIHEKPSAKHWLGTDKHGMDVMTRLMYGGQISLVIGFIVVFLETSLGVVMGGLAGYFGKWVDMLIMRIVDVFNCIPFMPLLIILGSVMDAMEIDPQIRIYYLMLLLGVLSWPYIARMVRGQILSLREQEFMLAAEATGISIPRRIFKHLVPNVIPQLIVLATMGLGSIILTESTLSFLGLGVKFPFASWGNIISGVSTAYEMTNFWFVWIPAGMLILLTVLGFNFVGDGLRDAFDPKMKR